MKKTIFMLALAIASVYTYAEEISPNQGVLGDWGGLRTRLYQDGVDFQLGFTTEAAYNTTGGDSKLLRNADQFNLGATFDFDKLFGWNGGRFQVTVTDRNGDNLSADANLGTLMQVQEIYGRGNTFRWTQFWYDQLLFDGAVNVSWANGGGRRLHVLLLLFPESELLRLPAGQRSFDLVQLAGEPVGDAPESQLHA